VIGDRSDTGSTDALLITDTLITDYFASNRLGSKG